ncbi:MAG TPA: hypothetical protein DCS07_05875 [Bdellovibrionales bacterium]|nr:hypothetical protein [Bdellovibrionales bacterium]
MKRAILRCTFRYPGPGLKCQFTLRNYDSVFAHSDQIVVSLKKNKELRFYWSGPGADSDCLRCGLLDTTCSTESGEKGEGY